MNQIAVASWVAAKAHLGQTRRGGKPYFTHVQRVVDAVNKHTAKAERVVVAYLHDVVEDSDITLQDLQRMGFSQEVVDAVNAITHKKGEKNEDYWQRVKNNPIALFVKKFDILDNLSDDPSPHQIAKYAKALLFLYGEGEVKEDSEEAEAKASLPEGWEFIGRGKDEGLDLKGEEAIIFLGGSWKTAQQWGQFVFNGDNPEAFYAIKK